MNFVIEIIFCLECMLLKNILDQRVKKIENIIPKALENII
jgi:hypothetical protein